MNKKPKKWYEVYETGEEQRFFIALSRNPKYDWRSTAAIAKEANLSLKQTEEIAAKYLKRGLIFQSPSNDENWGYWERVPDMLADDGKSIAKADQSDRLKKASPSMVDNSISSTFSDPLILGIEETENKMKRVAVEIEVIEALIDMQKNDLPIISANELFAQFDQSSFSN